MGHHHTRWQPGRTLNSPVTDIELTPDPHLLESMRAVGYSFETAVADVIDNSIAAEAKTIHLLTSAEGTWRVSVFDDGDGMDRETAVEAMTLAARSPLERRKDSDLGRFGLGLKTASLSQGRRLTVATKRDGVLTVFRWDLDRVLKSGRWLMQEVQPDEAVTLFGFKLLDDVAHGTLVCWDDLDLLTLAEGRAQSDFDDAVKRVKSHCELVFHRFVSGQDARKVTMTVNGESFEDLDPFLRGNKATGRHNEPLYIQGEQIDVTAYTLPFINKLTISDRRRALAPGSFRDSQGFYIYRGGRLVIWGTWFRLNPKTDLAKLARVRVDVPNSLDHLWALDIKKSAATPPRELRDQLKVLAGQFVRPSARVQTFRGRKPKTEDTITRAWDLVTERESAFRYEINRDHPLIQTLVSRMAAADFPHLDAVLELLETTYPVIDAHNRLSQDAEVENLETGVDLLVERARQLRPMFAASHPDEGDFLAMLLTMDPFSTAGGFEMAYRKQMAGTK